MGHKIPNVLGLVFAGVTVTVNFGDRGTAAVAAVVGYFIGAGIGYAIESTCSTRGAKLAWAWILGLLLAGGFLVVRAISEAHDYAAQHSAPSTRPRPSQPRRQHQPVRQSRPARTSFADQVIQSFPALSPRAQQAFRERTRGMTEEQTTRILWQLMAEGETRLSRQEVNEMASFYRKAVGTLSREEQAFVQQVNQRVSQGHGYSAAGQNRAQEMVQKGFGRLSARDNARFLELRARCIELGLFGGR